MDIFMKISNDAVGDLSLFRSRRTVRETSDNNATGEEKKPADKLCDKSEQEYSKVPDTEIEHSKDGCKARHKGRENGPHEIGEGKVIQFRTPETPNDIASIKLEMELETAKNVLLPVFPIVRYLKDKCMADDEFAALVNDDRKKLSKCFAYVESEIKKALGNSQGWLDDNEVYAYAETYYMTDEAVFEKIEAEKKAAEKKRREEVAQKRKEQEEKRKKAMAKSKKKTSQKDQENAPKSDPGQSETKTLAMQGQMSLL